MSTERLLLSEKYKAFLRCNAPVEFLEGTTAAGKTTVGLFKFMLKVAESSKKLHIIAAKDTGTAEKNIINKDLGIIDDFGMLAEYNGNGTKDDKIPHILFHTSNGDKVVYVMGYGDKKKWQKALGGQYRRVIYNAQVYANTGAGTYEKAVDMATKDFLSAGLNCIEYKNGARHTLADYADMAIRTASKRAYLQGEGEKRQEWGIHTVIVNKRGNPCPKCLPFCGKVLIDDVWSGGSRKDGSYPLVSKAISYGLYHPRCKDSHTTYFPGISTADDTWTKEELENIGLKNQQEARQQYAERQEKKYDRLAENSLDEENQKRYAARREEYYRRRKNKVLRDDPEYQERVRKRRAEYQKKHPTTQNTEPQFDKEALKQEIAGMDQQQASLKEKLQKVKDEEKSLTQKVYFDMSGTVEETEQLKGMSAKKKEIEAQISELNKQIWKKQEVYKNDVEKRLIEDGILQEAKFSKRMKPETVDELETTIRELHDKYGIMPKAVKYSPLEVRDATATYNWFDDTIYLSNNFNDSKEYLKKVAKSENSLVEYNKHYDIINRAKKSLEEADAVLADKSVKGFEREEARLKKTYAEIQLNETRMAVRENLTDCFTHEYGHFIHRHAETNYTIKKDAFGMRDMGGVFYARDWRYDVNKHYSARAKVAASGISRYATESPYETFAEGFLAMEKGEKIPDQIAEVIEEAKKRAGTKTVAKEAGSDIIEMTRKADDPRANLKFISDTTFDNLTISAKKKGALIIRGTKEAEEHLEKVGAAASTMGDILIFRKDVCISEVLEETHHFEQNFAKINDDKGEPLRTILNEIDAKQYLLDNAAKYKIPRNELELTQKQLESYQKQLETYKKGGRWE